MRRLIVIFMLLAGLLCVPVAAGAQQQVASQTTSGRHHARRPTPRKCSRRRRHGRKRVCSTRRKQSARKTHKHTSKKQGRKRKQTSTTKGTETKTGTRTTTTGSPKTGTSTSTSTGTATGSGTAGSDPTGGFPDPSGTPIPTGNLPGWDEDFADDFTATSLAADPQWTPYSGSPAGQPDEGWWDPTHDVMTDGELQLAGYPDKSADALGALPGSYVTGGVETTSFSQTYGKYLVRMRIDQGQGVSLSVLLWPISDGTHDEIDFAEDNGADPRDWNTATVHYGPANTKIVNALEVDLTQWHTYGVEWSPGEVVYTIDGRDWATVTNPNVPSLPMRIDLQTQSWRCGSDPWEECPNATTPPDVDLDVDWVVAYRPS
jgi:beta-glucanase (GH16 family)